MVCFVKSRLFFVSGYFVLCCFCIIARFGNAKSNQFKNSPSLARGDSKSSPSLAEGARGWVNPSYSSLRGFEKAEAIQNKNIDCHENSLRSFSRNDDSGRIAHKYPHLNLSIRALTQSYGISGRLDSEYYQTKYDAIERKIKGYQGGYCKLQDIGFFTNGSFIPENLYTQKAKRAYIRIKELSFNAPIRIQECIYIDDNFEKTNETMVKQNDFVVATIGNTIGKINLIPKELSGSFISNNTSRFRLTDESIIPEFLELLLRNFVVQEQIQREFTQTAQPKISNTSLENILIPKISSTTQEQIAQKIQQSFILRKKSKDLLQVAKAKVEQNIENSANQT